MERPMTIEMTKSVASRTGKHDFEGEASVAMMELRESMLSMIAGLPGATTRAVDLERCLGVSRTLGWQIHRLVTNPTPLTAGRHVPGGAAVGQVLRGARSAGVGEDVVARVEEAMNAFEALVDRHAGDRATFVTMLGSLAGSEESPLDIKTRRQAFRHNSQIWGVQVKVSLACGIMHPGADPSVYDMAVVRGLGDVRRLRAGAPFQVSGQRIVDSTRHITVAEDIGEQGAINHAGGARLLAEYCSRPLPELESRIEDGCLLTYLRDAQIGNAGSRTIYLADMTRGVKWQSQGDVGNHHIRSATVLKPIEVLILDTLVYKGMFGAIHPVARVNGTLARLGVTDPYAYGEDETLPIEPDLRRLGVGTGALTTPHVPRYREMVESVLSGVGWDPSAFEVFRCVVRYPALGSMVQVRFELPERGNW